jgi:hypothetical protein
MQGNGQDATRLKQANDQLAELWAVYCERVGGLPAPGTPAHARLRRAFMTGAALMKSRAAIHTFGRIASRRPLDDQESAMLARIIRGHTPKRDRWHWTHDEDAAVVELITRREAEGRPAPYQPNGDVQQLADRLGRSYWAVHRRMERLRKLDPPPGNCSNALGPLDA